jgi:hypothetical protein
MVRIARAYGQKPAVFWNQVWPERPASFLEMDRFAEEGLLRLLSSKTGVPWERVVRTTLRAYEACSGMLDGQRAGSNRTGMSLYCRSGSGNTVQFCLACLSEDAVPYFRRSWRLAFVTVCARHGLRLLDRCAACRAWLRFERTSLDAESLAVCYRCNSDLRSAPMRRIQPGQPTDRLIHFQERLLRVVEG